MSDKLPEFEPPQASVNRVIKSFLPDNVQLTKDARTAFTRAASIFIFYLTHCANDFCKEGKRQTISTQDIFAALEELDLSADMAEPLEAFLEEYRSEESVKRPTKIRKVGDGEEGSGAANEDTTDTADATAGAEEEVETSSQQIDASAEQDVDEDE